MSSWSLLLFFAPFALGALTGVLMALRAEDDGLLLDPESGRPLAERPKATLHRLARLMSRSEG